MRDKGFLGQHISQQTLHCHSVTANSSLREKWAGAMPFTCLVTYFIIAVFTVKIGSEILEGNTFWFFCIAFGLFNLSDKT